MPHAPRPQALAYSHLPKSLALAALVLSAVSAHSVVVRGTVTDILGAPVPGARVQLIQGKQTASFAVAGSDGSFEIRSGDSGRFLLLTSARTFAPNIGVDFYGGKTDVVVRTVVLSPDEIRTEVSVTATGTPTPLAQLTAPVTLVPRDDLSTRIGILDDLRQSPGVSVVQTGQQGGVTSLFVRGGNSDANKVLIDGIPAEDVGGVFDYGTVSSTGLAGPIREPSPGSAIELYRGPNSALYGSDSLASVVNLSTPRGTSLKPVLNYSGDAGNLHTWRNEALLSGTHNRADYLLAYSRFDTSNALPHNRFHASTAAANLGFNISSSTQLRFTLRNTDSAGGLTNGYNLYNLAQDGKQSDQDLYSGATLENTTLGGWHNLLRYGIARKREQAAYFGNSGNFLTFPDSFSPGQTYSGYFGNIVSLRGANGYTAVGRAQIFSSNRDQASNRDELYYQSDKSFRHHITALFGFRYENERGSFNIPEFFEFQKIQRTNFQYNLQIGGDLGNRIFYSFGGGLQKNHLYGIAGTPRLGVAWIAVRPDPHRYFRGTRLRANAATGVQEPNLATEFSSLYRELLAAGSTTDIAAYHVTPLGPQRSRTFDVGIDQSLIGDKLILKAGYFHNQFSHQLEFIGANGLEHYFSIPAGIAAQLPPASLNSLAYRAQGLELEIQYQPFNRIFIRGGYTYLASLVEQSFSSDNAAHAINPNIPGIPIGALSPLVGNRPFRRPPHTGFFAVQYTGTRFSAALKGALSSSSDDSTFQLNNDLNRGNTLLLPNNNLDFGYTKLDGNVLFKATNNIVFFTQLDNLLGQQHIGPIGYPGLPFTIRAGMKIKIHGD